MEAEFHLLFARHGNTFAPGEAVVRLGVAEDPPLTASGQQQARELAARLAHSPLRPRSLYASHLRRAQEFARLLAEHLSLPLPQLDPRLNELDYGAWGGLSDQDIAARFGAPALDDWNQRGIWPASGGWGEGEVAVAARLNAFAHDVATRPGPVLAVSSAGLIRYALALDPVAHAATIASGSLKIATGRLAHLIWDRAKWRCAGWNLPSIGN